MTHQNNVTKTTIDRFRPLFATVWQAIGADVIEVNYSFGQPVTAETIAESCTDAARLHSFATSDEESELALDFYDLPYAQRREIAITICNEWSE